MSQVSKYPISRQVYDKIFDVFLKTFVELKSKKKVHDFFDEFLTPTEKIILTKRLAISLLLAKGFDYRNISNILKVSSTTIGGVSIQYKYGSTLHKIVQNLVTDETIENFWLEIAQTLTSIGTIGTKGTGGWKYLNTEVKKKLLNKPF